MDQSVDLARLRTGRLARLQAAMRARHVEACLLFNEPNIRYATGASAMPIWSNTTFVRCALVPSEGRAILFEHPNSMHLFRGFEAEVRPMHAWEFYDDTELHAKAFARETVAALRELGVTGPRLAVDRLGTPGFLALQREGIALSDSAPVTTAAREVKTPEEIVLLEANGLILMDMLADFERAIAPGIREADRAPRFPAKFMPRRYEVMIHGIGLEEESPSVAYPGDAQPNGDRVLQENMALVVELYCGEVGGRDGVKLGDQVVVTPGGVKDLVPYGYSAALLH